MARLEPGEQAFISIAKRAILGSRFLKPQHYPGSCFSPRPAALVRDMPRHLGNILGQCGSHYAADSCAGLGFLSLRSGGSVASVS